jgi:hypothetical protein
MSVKVPEGPSVQSHGHRRHSTVSSLGAQTTRYSPPIGGQIQELDGGLTQFETIAELPAERSPGIVPDATPGAIDELEAVGMQPSTTYTAYAPRGT